MTHPADCRRGAIAAGRRVVRCLAGVLAASLLLVPAACRKTRTEPVPEPLPTLARGDAIFLAEAPAFVPDDVDAELGPMQIARLYVPAATLSRGGAIKGLPPPPSPLKQPLVLTVLGEEGAAASLAGRGEAMGSEWARSLAPILADARSWGRVEGVHFHLWPSPELAKDLGAGLAAVRKGLGVPVSVTLPPTAQPEKWKPLAGAASEALVLAFGQRTELEGQIVSEWPEEAARSFPLPFRLLLVFGGYGRTGDGRNFAGRLLPDGMIDEFSKDHALDFDFGQVFSSEPGTVYIFKPRAGARGSSLTADGGYARFQILTIAEALRFLTRAGRWSVPHLRGRVFLVEGVPKDGHLLGYPAVRALLTGQPLEARLEVQAAPGESGHGSTEFAVHATNAGPVPTDLSHYNNWIQIRVEGGTVALVKPGDFDRYEQLTSEADGYKPTSSSRAVVARLYENLFAPGERNKSGSITVAGTHPRIFLSWHLTLPDGKVVSGPEIEAAVTPPAPAKAAPKAKKRLRGKK